MSAITGLQRMKYLIFLKIDIIMFAEILGWIATLFRGAGMLAKRANMVKYLVSIGNLFWMLNGIFTSNIPLIVSNGFCLLVMVYEIIKTKKGGKE